MADPTTSLGFTLPTVGLDRDTWGGLLNSNWSLADTLIAANKNNVTEALAEVQYLLANIRAYIEPVGTLKFWPMPTAPYGWYPCDGFAISRAAYPELFALIGTTYGAGDGSTTFNIPNYYGMTPVHRGGWINFGQTVGEVTHTLSGQEMPAHAHYCQTNPGDGQHQHYYYAVRAAGGANASPGGSLALNDTGNVTEIEGGHQHTFVTDNQGGGGSHNNVQPSIGANLIIKCLQLI